MTPPVEPSGSHLFEEFHCRGCGGQEAYRSRPRGFFEKYVLPCLFLQAVRCEHCYQRSYVWLTVHAIERSRAERKRSESQPAGGAKSDTRVA